LSLQTISEVCPIKKSNQSKIEAVVYIFSLLLVYTLAILFLNKSNKRFSVNAQSYQVAQIGMEMNETDSVKQLTPSKEVTQTASPAMDNWRRVLNPFRRLTDSVKQLLPSKEVTQMASPAMDNWSQVLNPSRREEEVQPSRHTKRRLQKSIAASAKKKTFDPQNPTLIVTEGDKKRFDDIFIKQTFLSKDVFTIEGSCGPIHRVDQFQNTADTVGRDSNLRCLKSQLDHFFSSRTRQGVNLLLTREYDINIGEAVIEQLHNLLTKAGYGMFRLQSGVVTGQQYVEQILIHRSRVFLSSTATNIMANQLDGRFTSQDYIRTSERSAEWNIRLLNWLSTNQGLRTNCFKSLVYPTQVFDDAMSYIDAIRRRVRSSENSSFIVDPTLKSQKDTLEKKKELQNLFISGQQYVSEKLSILVDLQNAHQHPKNSLQDIIQRDYVNRLAEEYNNLSDMANQMHNLSGSSLTVPPLGRIITLENAIERADKSKSDCINQWRTGRAPGRQDQLANKKWLKNVNSLPMVCSRSVNW
jgi:hypothetical protein